ncbi:hypothetical protein B0J12DRAFT_758292 [Macrophomina phaseolina]|uniref:Uncharacterized protein n=1 Tax=Macrophomina phaseolina TaxID=35725 RepID=A0ABQ8GRM7_9PEZI|nr:hypothetical protein B0J12DRAFT_758292 [Macrophomina phaseolina]
MLRRKTPASPDRILKQMKSAPQSTSAHSLALSLSLNRSLSFHLDCVDRSPSLSAVHIHTNHLSHPLQNKQGALLPSHPKMRSISTLMPLMPLSAMGAIANAAPISSSPSSLTGAADLLPRSVDAAATSLMARKEIEHETEDSHIAGTDDAAHRHREQEGKDDTTASTRPSGTGRARRSTATAAGETEKMEKAGKREAAKTQNKRGAAAAP